MGPLPHPRQPTPPLTRQDRLDPDRPVAAKREAEALVALVDPYCPEEKEAGVGVGSMSCLVERRLGMQMSSSP